MAAHDKVTQNVNMIGHAVDVDDRAAELVALAADFPSIK